MIITFLSDTHTKHRNTSEEIPGGDIIIHAGDLMNIIGDGKEFGIEKITYVYQKEAKGISDAIKQAEGSIHDKCAIILGDNFEKW